MINSFKAVIKKFSFSPDKESYCLSLETDEWDGSFLPGQFLNIRLPVPLSENYTVHDTVADFFSHRSSVEKRYPFLRRPFSIYKTIREPLSGKTIIELLIAKLGLGTKQLAQLPIGTELELFSPIGNGFPHLQEIDEVYCIGGGIGIAPMLETSRFYKNNGVKTSIFYGLRSLNSAILTKNEINSDIADEFFVATDKKEEGVYHGFITDLFKKKKLISEGFNPSKKVVFACGPTPMFRSLAKILREYKLEGYFSVENFMACGIGSCMGCVIKIKDADKSEARNLRACQEGPVFHFKHMVELSD
ncbi:MAG: hypothetical protein HQK84_11175 [Nitrospinae bacterium]|nr:hypothetical protein [Nitrospinota bacterium]